MYENKSGHTYSYALGFLWKNRCDMSSPWTALWLCSPRPLLHSPRPQARNPATLMPQQLVCSLPPAPRDPARSRRGVVRRTARVPDLPATVPAHGPSSHSSPRLVASAGCIELISSCHRGVPDTVPFTFPHSRPSSMRSRPRLMSADGRPFQHCARHADAFVLC
jgi:hypothetical protein